MYNDIIKQMSEKYHFLNGVGSVLNIGGDSFDYNNSKTPAEIDAEAIRSDWASVGKDISEVIKKL